MQDSPLSVAEHNLRSLGQQQLPRIMTQICRDESDCHYGCCDRNWWHYKIRDFPSVMLQQAGYAIFVAWRAGLAPASVSLARQTAMFWLHRAVRTGAFEEYYPHERGFPPLAFTTLAIAKLCMHGVVSPNEIIAGLEVAVAQLLSRFESEAANQQVAATAALATLRKIGFASIEDEQYESILSRTLALQHYDGWFLEYGGPDLGYLSVTMDCLWDIYDVTGDRRSYLAILRAFDFLSWFVLGPVGAAGMHNARNTDYILPYGISRLLREAPELRRRVVAVIDRLYGSVGSMMSVLAAVDDRYWCHYVGHSVFRAASVLSDYETDSPDHATTSPVARQESLDGYASTGHYCITNASQSLDVMISGKKGGILTGVWRSGELVSDYGWIIRSGRLLYVTHWWSNRWEVQKAPHHIRCEGHPFRHSDHVSTPLKHFALRIVSRLLGGTVIDYLKSRLIYKRGTRRIGFQRDIRLLNDRIVVTDVISGLRDSDTICRAPRASKRHVASADGFHPEDLALIRHAIMSEAIQPNGDQRTIVTTYSVDSTKGKP